MHIFSILFHSDNRDKCMWIDGGFAGKFEVFFCVMVAGWFYFLHKRKQTCIFQRLHLSVQS